MNDIDKVWDLYRKTKDHAQRELLILEYIPVVKLVAGRLSMHFKGHVELDDLISYGIFGLIDAIDKFTFDKGVKFETYASLRIRGSIFDSIRKLDWVPRAVRQENRRLEQLYSELEAKLGREPSDEEIAAALNLPVDEARELIKKASLTACVSLDDYLEQNHENIFVSQSSSQQTSQTPEEEALKREMSETLAAAIDKLSEKEKLVVTLYYFEELTLKEISKILEVSESRVSQIHSKAVFKLKTRLGKYVISE